jgi:DNA-binding transcriptional regulator LsrR (DeoR family)
MLVVPILGMKEIRTAPVEANNIAATIAESYGGQSEQLACPAFLTEQEAKVMVGVNQVKKVLRRMRQSDIVFSGMGRIPEDAGADVRMSNDPVMDQKLRTSARNAGAVGEVCYFLFGADGREVTTEHRAIGLGYDGLREIAQDPERDVVLVCGGDKWRIRPLRIALEAGLASVLVSDTVTARELLVAEEHDAAA